MASHLGNLGLCYFWLGDYRRAIDHQEQRLAIAREIGDRQGEGVSLGNLGNCYYSLGDYRRAIDHHVQRLAIARQIGDRRGECNGLVGLGDVYRDTGQLPLACQHFQDAIDIADATANRQNQHEARFGLALARLYMGELAAALESIDKARQYDFPTNTVAAWTATGIIQLRQGDPAAASEAFARGSAEADRLLALSGQNVSALDNKGLALCGHALCENERHLAAAAEAFAAARKITGAKGVVAGVLNRLDALAVADKEGLLAPARRAAEGG
jgi:tetratricopeptide (TPR) repeat protein